jgi:hypothetical protein
MRIEPYGKQQDLSPQASRSGLCEISKHEKVLVAHGHKKKKICTPSAVFNMLLVDGNPICLQATVMERVRIDASDFQTISDICHTQGIALRHQKFYNPGCVGCCSCSSPVY